MGSVLGPCGWCVPDPTCCTKWDDATAEEKERARRWAAWLLWVATGRQLGRCETTLRPCRRDCTDTWPPRCGGTLATAGRWFASISGSAVSGWGGGGCGCNTNSCSCGPVCEIDLPGAFPEPVEVLVDGQPVPLDVFRVDNGRTLVWEQECVVPCCEAMPADDPHSCCCPVDPCELTCFPDCQDLSLPPDCPGTWQITYAHGVPVPEEGLWAAAELACEIAKACGGAGPGECRLPSNIVSLTRNQVSMEFANNGSVTNATGRVLRFGIPVVDMWVTAMNPYGNTEPASVYSPDINPGRVQTWP